MTSHSPEVFELQRFLADHQRIVVITGAGISAPSGIPTYRDQQGTWQHSEPIKHQEFITEQAKRQRYWARSLLGWPAVRDARPNAAHRALARLEKGGHIGLTITQNVDRLHQCAGSTRVIDLHGRLDQVRCLQCQAVYTRDQIQHKLLQHNPHISESGTQLKPDGDADVAEVLVRQLSVPGCDHCGGTLMPDVVFFGGTVPAPIVRQCMAATEQADAVLAIGSSLQVYSGFRFCRRAAQLGKPLAIINPGATRADALASLKLKADCETLLPLAAEDPDPGVPGRLAG